MKYKNKSAFTLVEMSIVLIIISIIIASILGGSIYIRQAEIQSFSSEILDIKKGSDEYANMYGTYAGDSDDASELFGCSGCDGDGDGEINGAELQLFWQHLSLSEFIEGTYDGSSTVGQGTPISQTDNSAIFKIKELNNRIVLVLTGITPEKTALSPKEIQQIDSKYDNGNPFSGNIIVEAGSSFSDSDCITGDEYNVSNDKKQCNLLYVLIGEKFTGYHWETNMWGSCNGTSNWVVGAFGACTKNCPNDGAIREGCCTNLADPTCSGACGSGYQTRDVSCNRNDGTQTRNVFCADEDGSLVADSLCSADEPDDTRICTNPCDIAIKPETKEECTIGDGTCDWYMGGWTCDAEPVWNSGTWGVCSGVCGSGNMTETRSVTCPEATGTKTRTVYCPYPNCDGVEPVAADTCTSTEFSIPCPPPQPDTTRACSLDCEWSVGAWSACLPAPPWDIGLWSGVCSQNRPSCTAGIENRAVNCTDTAGTMTRAVNCISPPCVSAAPDSTEGCVATCATPAPGSSRICNNNLALLTIENSISTVTLHTQIGDNWIGCLNTN